MEEHKEETDIYCDLPSFKYDEILEKTTNNKLQARVVYLEEIVEKLSKENVELRTQCSHLSTNISSLFKTAQREVKKKDNMIRELNQRLICFRVDRYSRHTKKRNLGSGCQEEEKKQSQKSPKKLTKEPTPNSTKNNSNREIENKKCGNDDKKIESKLTPTVTQAVIPKMKCHTLYSRRMFNKIYNIDQNTEKKTVASEKSVEEVTETVTSEKESGKPDEVAEPGKDPPSVSPSSRTEMAGVSADREPGSVLQFKDKTSNPEVQEEIHGLVPSNVHVEKPFPESVNTPLKLDTVQEVTKDKSLGNRIEQEVGKYSLETDGKISVLKGKSTEITGNILNETQNSINTIDIVSPKVSIISDSNKKSTFLNNKLDSSINVKPLTHSDTFLLNIDKLQKKSNMKIPPISSGWNMATLKNKDEPENEGSEKLKSESKENNFDEEKSTFVEALFGSPIKWADNSMDETQTIVKLTAPTAYEDSCSAQIENTRFKKTQETIDGIAKLHVEVDRTKLNTSVENCKLIMDKNMTTIDNLPNVSNDEKILSTYSKNMNITCKVDKVHNTESRPFKELNSDKTVKFSTFINHESFESHNIASSSEKQNCFYSAKPSSKNPKYQDSLLGQFDDTTQLIYALARGHSKLSPINTPVKDKLDRSSSPGKKDEHSSESLNKNICTDLPKVVDSETKNNIQEKIVESAFKLTPHKNESEKKISPSPSKLENRLSSVTKSPLKVKEEKKTIFLDQPINILCPRKTPRIVGKALTQQTNLLKDKGLETDNKGNNLKNNDPIKPKQAKNKEITKKRVNFNSREPSPQDSNCRDAVLRTRKDSVLPIDKLNCVGISWKHSLESEDLKNKGKSRKGFEKHSPAEFSFTKARERRENGTLEVNDSSHKRSPSRKENSPRPEREKSRFPPYIKNIKFKKPVLYKSSYRRPNCNFRHSSVERKILKDRRQQIRSTPVREVPKKSIQNSFSVSHSKKAESPKNIWKNMISPRTHLIVRQTNSSWGTATSDVVSTKSEDILDNSSLKKKTLNPIQEDKSIKWILRPIDIDTHSTTKRNNSVYHKSPSPFGESSLKNKTPSPKIIERIRSPSISSEEPPRSRKTPEQNSVSKSPGIVIVSRKRPALFGVAEITDKCSVKIKKEYN